MHVHDDYLELLAEYGLVGTVLCGIFLSVHLVSGLVGVRKIVAEQIRLQKPPFSFELALAIGTFSAVSALLFHSLVDFNMHIPANALLVAFLMGILARPRGDEIPQAADAAPEHVRWFRWGIALPAVVLLGISLRLFPGEFYAEKSRVAFRDGRYAESRELAQRGIEWEKKNPALYGHLGDAEHFLTLKSQDPESARLLHESAVTAYEAGLKLFPHDTGLLLKDAQALDLLGRFAEAEEVFQRLLHYDPMFGNVYAYYGLHWQLQNHIKTAERCFRIADALGEKSIAPEALKNVERIRADPATQSLISMVPEPDIDLPAETLLPRP